MNISFKDFSNSITNDINTSEEKKILFYLSFLALLELIKSGVLNASQGDAHNEINILGISKSEHILNS